MEISDHSILRVIDPGFGAAIQDRGRAGWRRFGVPVSGCMDPHAADCANRLLDNPAGAPLIELLFQGAKLAVLQDIWVAICGAEVECGIPTWRAHHVVKDTILSFHHCHSGVWSYLAVEGGIDAPEYFGSASCYARGGIGAPLAKDQILRRSPGTGFSLPRGVSGRIASWTDRRDHKTPPWIRVYIGPQWKDFSVADRDRFLKSEWTVTPQSDRVGYRLDGPPLKATPSEIVSEPVRLGSVQVPENGKPIVTMRDGPTVGGYPKIAVVDELDLPWVAQVRPGQTLRFQLVS